MRRDMYKYGILLVVIAAVAVGCGTDFRESEPPGNTPVSVTLEDAVVQYATNKLAAVVSGDPARLRSLPAPERDLRLGDLGALQERGERVSDYGLSIAVLGTSSSTMGILIIYREAVVIDVESGPEHIYSSMNTAHRLLLQGETVTSDESIDEAHPDFDAVRRLPVKEWRLIRQLPHTPFSPLPGRQVEEPDKAETDGRMAQDLTASSVRAYALRWCDTPNPAYPNYYANTTQGGDCTNFSSQCLEAGGLPFVDNPSSRNRRTWATYWWSNRQNRWDHSQTWSVVSALRRHFKERSTTRTSHARWEDAHVGDVVFFEYPSGTPYHSCVFTTAQRKWYRPWSFDLRVSCHTDNVCDQNFYDKMRSAGYPSIEIVHMP